MKGIHKINFDGICIYVDSSHRISILGKIVLILLNLTGWSFFLFFASTIDGEKMGNYILPLIIMFLLLVFGLGKLTAWNIWGREFIIINAKAITYTRSYGIVQTPEKIVKHKTLAYSYDTDRYYKDNEYVKFRFYDYDDNNNPVCIFEASVPMSRGMAYLLIEYMRELFQREQNKPENKISFSLN